MNSPARYLITIALVAACSSGDTAHPSESTNGEADVHDAASDDLAPVDDEVGSDDGADGVASDALEADQTGEDPATDSGEDAPTEDIVADAGGEPSRDHWRRPRYWRPSWSDEFNGPEPGAEACYDNEQTPPQCLTLYWHNEDCPERALDELADLNKCNWSVFHLYNWMDWGKPLGEGMNAFDPEMVTVAGGELVLRAAAALPDGGLGGDLDIDQVMARYDCGNPPDTGHELSTDCPIRSGGLWSKQMGEVAGLLQTYGRFEIRARLPVGPGSWPAHWMLPQEGPWPGAGEIDIMEATSKQPIRTNQEAAANFHDGVTVEIDGETVNTHMSAGAMGQRMTVEQMEDEYHVFSVDWDAERLVFYVDEIVIGEVRDGKMLRNTDTETGEFVGHFPVDVPDQLFHMVLNSTVNAFDDDDYPDPRGFAPQTHHIDYVRGWTECDDPESHGCPAGGEWHDGNCRFGDLPDRSDLFIVDDALVYPAEAGDDACPDGGDRDADLCVVFSPDGPVHTFVSDGGFFAQGTCRANTLSDSPRCHDPCGGLGVSEGRRCRVGEPPEGARGTVSDGVMAYTFLQADRGCPVGIDRGSFCEWGRVPEGRNGWTSFDGDVYFLDTVCNPADAMANCTTPCSGGARWDGARCHVASAPPGTNAFVWEGGFYYDYLDTGTYAARCPLGSDDGAHCYLGAAPGGGPTAARDRFYVEAACGNVSTLD